MNTSALVNVLTRAGDRSRVERAQQAGDWIVYGAGRTGRKWVTALAESGRKVHAFLDRAAIPEAALPVYPLAECPDALRRRCSVLLALHNPGADVAQVRRQLLAAGFQEVWLLQDLIDAWPQLSHFWLAPASETLPHQTDIVAAHDALADEHSQTLMTALLDQRLNGNADALSRPETETHYLPLGLPRPPSPMRYIDCGAYTGDTIQSFLNHGITFEAIAAFEPEPNNYPRLCKTIAPFRAAAFPCGVWDSMTQLCFSSDEDASHVDSTGEIMVQVVALDQALPNFAPTLIKMDIEGAENRALLGARKTIETHRPYLAISTYHKPRDLWELLLLIKSWNLDYRFYLRTHCHNGFETVLYGHPG